MRIGPTEIFMILIVVLIIFGPKNLPKLGKMFGQTMKGFKEGIDDDDDERRYHQEGQDREGRKDREKRRGVICGHTI